MRILLVTEDVPVAKLGGAGKHAVLLGNALLEEGHEVELLGQLRKGVEGNNDFKGTVHATVNFAGTGWQEFRFGAFLPARNEHAARRIWQAIQRLGIHCYDVIHYHGHINVLGSLVPAGVPFVQTLHDQGSECMTRVRFKDGQICNDTDPRACASCATPEPNAVQRWLSTNAVVRHRQKFLEGFGRHQTIFVSDFLKRRFEMNVKPQNSLKSQVVHNFSDCRGLVEALETARSRKEHSKPLLLMVGRLDEAKGFAAVLDLLPETFLQDWRVRVIGDGPMRDSLPARHAQRGVEFVGYMAQEDVYLETAMADVCVVPSIWEEAFGTTTLEALVLGRHVFALNRGATPELRRYAQFDGQLHLFEAPSNLVDALIRLPAKRAPLAESISFDCDVRKRLPEVLEIYKAAMTAAGSRAQVT